MPLTPEPGLNEVLETLSNLHPKKIDLSLGRLRRLLKALGNPEKNLPAVFHVAGTNGKGSVIANLRAIFEAAGLKVHVYTSPHLVSFRERIRLGGALITEKNLIDTLHRVEAANNQNPITFFEITTAAAFLAFSTNPADVLLLEVGLGGQFDATNVIQPLVSVITPVGVDHKEFLGNEISSIAAEKAGISKSNVPVIIGVQSPEALDVLINKAEEVSAPFFHEGRDWFIAANHIFQGFGRKIDLSKLPLKGRHQIDNAGIALAALFSQEKFEISDHACRAGLKNTKWPARFQKLDPKYFKSPFPKAAQIWLDGGHNPLAGRVLARQLSELPNPTTLIVGMMAVKDFEGFLEPLVPHLEKLIAVPVPGEANGAKPETILKVGEKLGVCSQVAASVEDALEMISATDAPNILITGSLYLAGSVLRNIGFTPT